MTEWKKGEFLGQQDSACLQQAAAEELTLVTYDRRTIPALLKAWAEEERTHGGVICARKDHLALAYRQSHTKPRQPCAENIKLELDEIESAS